MIGIGLSIVGGNAGGWMNSPTYAAADSADSIVKYPGMIANFRTGRNAITPVATGSIAAAAAADLRSSGAVFNDLFTFTRSSVKKVLNASGSYEDAAIDAPGYDRTNGKRQLLLEGAATNLMLQSEDFNTTWIKAGSPTITVNSTTSPDGTSTADLFTRTITGPTYLTQTVTKAASNLQYAASFFVKAGTGRYFSTRTQGTFPSRADVVFDLTLGVISTAATAFGSFSGASASILNVGNGWFRCSLVATTDTATGIDTVVSFNSNGVVVDGTDSVSTSSGYLWGAQLELGSFATSPIRTTSAAVTRAADSCQFSTKALALIARSAAGVVVRGQALQGSLGRVIGGGSSTIMLSINAAQVTWRAGTTAFINFGTFTAPLPVFGAALGWNGSGKAGSHNGSTIVTDAIAMDATLSAAYLGRDSGGNFANGWYDELTVYPFKPTNAALVSKAVAYT